MSILKKFLVVLIAVSFLAAGVASYADCFACSKTPTVEKSGEMMDCHKAAQQKQDDGESKINCCHDGCKCLGKISAAIVMPSYKQASEFYTSGKFKFREESFTASSIAPSDNPPKA